MAEHLWEIQPGESAKAFAAFAVYRRLGSTRTVEETWRQYRSRPGDGHEPSGQHAAPRAMPYFSEWAVKWRWQEHALAWDQEQADIERELQEQAGGSMRRRFASANSCEEKPESHTHRGRRLLMRLLQGMNAGQLDRLGALDLLPQPPEDLDALRGRPEAGPPSHGGALGRDPPGDRHARDGSHPCRSPALRL